MSRRTKKNRIWTGKKELFSIENLVQLEGLKGSPAMEDALKQCKFVARQYAYFYR